MTDSGKIESVDEISSDRFWTFAYKAGLKDLATAYLNSMGTEVVQNILKPVDPRTLQNTGTCPVCFGNTKLLNGTMMRHGWSVAGRRQRGVLGLTTHTGPCFGVGYQPFQLSPEGTKDYLRLVLIPFILKTEDQLAALKNRPETISVQVSRVKAETLDQNHKDYDRQLKRQIEQTEQKLNALEQEAKDLRAHIADWELRPLPGT
jgi:hypothetical protein